MCVAKIFKLHHSYLIGYLAIFDVRITCPDIIIKVSITLMIHAKATLKLSRLAV